MEEINLYSISEAVAHLQSIENDPIAAILASVFEELSHHVNEVDEENSTNPNDETLDAQNNIEIVSIETTSDSSDNENEHFAGHSINQDEVFLTHSVLLQRRGRVPVFRSRATNTLYYYQQIGRIKYCTIGQKITLNCMTFSNELDFSGVPLLMKQFCKHSHDSCWCCEGNTLMQMVFGV